MHRGHCQDQRIFSNGNSYVPSSAGKAIQALGIKVGTWLSGRMHGEATRCVLTIIGLGRALQGHYIWSDGSEYFGEFHEARYGRHLSWDL